jgi:hypothetical protein
MSIEHTLIILQREKANTRNSNYYVNNVTLNPRIAGLKTEERNGTCTIYECEEKR